MMAMKKKSDDTDIGKCMKIKNKIKAKIRRRNPWKEIKSYYTITKEANNGYNRHSLTFTSFLHRYKCVCVCVSIVKQYIYITTIDNYSFTRKKKKNYYLNI